MSRDVPAGDVGARRCPYTIPRDMVMTSKPADIDALFRASEADFARWEVVKDLIDSCIDCVASWRHSPGHWGAVRGRHRLFGYDIRRGRNGIWYGTGIFAN